MKPPAVSLGGVLYVIDGFDDADGTIRLNNEDRCESMRIAPAKAAQNSSEQPWEWRKLSNPSSGDPMTLRAEAPKFTAATHLNGWIVLAGLEEARRGKDASKARLLHCESFRPGTGNEYRAAEPLEDPPMQELQGLATFRDKLYLFGESSSKICIFDTNQGVWESVSPTFSLPVRMRTIRAPIQGSPLLCLGQFVNKDPHEYGHGHDAGPGQPWQLLPPYEVGRAGSSTVLVRC